MQEGILKQMADDKKIQEMQFLEQNFQNLILQKQAFQMELSETNSALKEIEKAGDEVFKIIGQLMIKTDKSSTKKEFTEAEINTSSDAEIDSPDPKGNDLEESVNSLQSQIRRLRRSENRSLQRLPHG